MELQGRYETLRKSGMGLATISYDPVTTLAAFAGRRGITLPMLSDPGSATITRYGLLNTTVDPLDPLFGYPFPGTFILDPTGVVTSRYFEATYQERNTLSSIVVKRGGQIDVPATKVSSPHVDITTYTTDRVAAPGTHFSVVLDITPGPRIHVYAPSVQGYKPVVLAIKPQPGVLVRAAQYPEPEDYYFTPLDEHVPVYQRPFRIVQDVAIDPSPTGTAALKGMTTLTLKGTLSYQACDDKVCFNPQTVPLTWTISLRGLDRERPKPPGGGQD